MHLVEQLQSLMIRFGAEWVMWLMLGLSVVSVFVALERAWFYWAVRGNVWQLAQGLHQKLQHEGIDATLDWVAQSNSSEATVLVAGLRQANAGPQAAHEAMLGASALQRVQLEKRLAYLGTLGNNAPFIGLFGTVIGVVHAFEQLGSSDQMASGSPSPLIMSSISEALVATAVGLVVAIPAVAVFNVFQRHIRAVMANTEALTRILLAYLISPGKSMPPVQVGVSKPYPLVGGRG